MNLQYISDNNDDAAGVFIPIKDWNILTKKYNGLEDELDYSEPTKEEILANIRQGLKEVQLIKQGKLKSRPAKELLNEL